VVLTRSGISRLVTRLEKEGLVDRDSVEQDARGVYARLTDEGEAAFRRTWPL
ncbi:MAG: winged helix DNA-binding protein, partial [Gemmatimonadetes bacterium]|nr:winged helix DNA-binding protein [Gemmatimonadota bacterium]NIR35938.1 winged helix DNA-binding protein [Actinomycetota bacterium]NIU79487.1 winged helix DNA-binding protein [Gammaproteobacteria bacterium]NIT87641.1 winged helix DNA-binding protein [Gemmatimonadota bacterium]NIY12513.1 winged helix DNA-binding protein [Gemmatimonadota bacterium]